MKLIRIRMLNDRGMSQMQALLANCVEAPQCVLDFERDILPLLCGSETSEAVPNHQEIDALQAFPRRYEMAEYLHGIVPSLGLTDPSRRRGLWAWFALAWFQQLAPLVGGARAIGEYARWLPDSGWKYYRHLVLGPFLIYASNSDCPGRAMAVLHNPPHEPGELVGQVAATQDIAQSRAAIGAATALYYDRARGVIKRGAAGKKPGSARRFRAVIDQLDLTFDLHSLSEERLMALLPPEFDRFRARP